MELPIISESSILLEMSKSAAVLWRELNDYDIATITSFITSDNDNRPVNKVALSTKKNKLRNKKLMKDLRNDEYGPKRVTGFYLSPETNSVEIERSYFIANNKNLDFEDFKSQMINLARNYEQESVIVWNHSSGTAYMFGTRDYSNYELWDTYNTFKFDDLEQRARTIYGKHFFTFVNKSDNEVEDD